MDAMDALEDLLSRCYGHSDEDVVHLLSSLETTTSKNIVARSSVFNAIRYTPLEYAVKFSPLASVQSLLAEGVDAAEEPSLAYAAMCGRADLNKFLIDNHANVNMKDSQGRTALHYICYRCHYHVFFDIIRYAESQIEWDSCTSNGQNMLDLFEMGVSEGQASYLSPTQIDEFRSILADHITPFQLDVVHDDEFLDMPGTFPVD